MAKPNPKKADEIKPPAATPAPAPVAAPSAVVQEAEYPDSRSAAERLQVTLQDGRIDIASLRTANKEKLREVFEASLKDQEFRKFIGLESTPNAPVPQIVSPTLIGGLFDTVSNVQAAVYAKKTGIPYEEVQRLVKWTPEEHSFLDKQGSALVNKYIPPKWLKYSDVTLFAVLVYSMMQNKAGVVANYANERMKRMGVPDNRPAQPQPIAKAPEPKTPTPIAPRPAPVAPPEFAPASDNGLPGGGGITPQNSFPTGDDARSLG